MICTECLNELRGYNQFRESDLKPEDGSNVKHEIAAKPVVTHPLVERDSEPNGEPNELAIMEIEQTEDDLDAQVNEHEQTQAQSQTQQQEHDCIVLWKRNI